MHITTLSRNAVFISNGMFGYLKYKYDRKVNTWELKCGVQSIYFLNSSHTHHYNRGNTIWKSLDYSMRPEGYGLQQLKSLWQVWVENPFLGTQTLRQGQWGNYTRNTNIQEKSWNYNFRLFIKKKNVYYPIFHTYWYVNNIWVIIIFSDAHTFHSGKIIVKIAQILVSGSVWL